MTNKKFLILEGAYINESIGFNGKSIEELRKENPRVIRFVATLQTVNDVNRNKRYYPKNVLENAINDPRIQDIMKRNSFFIEVGHPESLEVRRQQRVEENNVCGIIKKTWFDGNKLKGLIETTADPIGTAWKDKILFNGVIPAFSLRATGDFHWDNNLQANVVDNPLTMFSYDLVQYPSHSLSTMETLTEDAMIFDIPRNHNEYNSLQIFNEGAILEIPDPVEMTPKTPSEKRVHNLTESYLKNVKKSHEYYAYSPKDKVTFNENHTVTVERENLIKVVNVQDYIRKDISYNIYDFLNRKN